MPRPFSLRPVRPSVRLFCSVLSVCSSLTHTHDQCQSALLIISTNNYLYHNYLQRIIIIGRDSYSEEVTTSIRCMTCLIGHTTLSVGTIVHMTLDSVSNLIHNFSCGVFVILNVSMFIFIQDQNGKREKVS